MTRFVALSVLTLLVVSAGTAIVSQHIAHDEAIRDARSRSEGIARGIAAPLVNDAVRRSQPDAVRALTVALTNRMRDGAAVAHIELWDRSGRLFWSDDVDDVGTRSPLPGKLLDLGEGESAVMRPGERSPHPGRDPGEESLVEVYVGATDADGAPFLFEAYIPPQRVQEDFRAILTELLPLSLGALLLLQLAMMPVALSLARRIDRATTQRSLILSRALLSWHVERRRLAQSLHDGVIQDLSAMSYALPAVLDQLPDTPSAADARVVAERMKHVLVQNLRDLRSMLTDLVPAGLEGTGLHSALDVLAEHTRRQGIQVELSFSQEVAPEPPVAGLVYRTVREGLRNVEKHAEAEHAWVRVDRDDQLIRIVVSDDGQGIGGSAAGDGHVGMRLVEQFVEDVGGTFEVADGPDGGARLHVEIPATLPDLDLDHLGPHS